ncbi:hypothetical protein AgCh_012107 [Apium graveolens]
MDVKKNTGKTYATDPCIDYYVDAYLNRPDVQKALHTNVTKLDHVWQRCSGLTNWVDYSSTSIPQLKELMASGTRGTGKQQMEKHLEQLEILYPDKAKGMAKFNVSLAHMIITVDDFMIVPSRF